MHTNVRRDHTPMYDTEFYRDCTYYGPYEAERRLRQRRSIQAYQDQINLYARQFAQPVRFVTGIDPALFAAAKPKPVKPVHPFKVGDHVEVIDAGQEQAVGQRLIVLTTTFSFGTEAFVTVSDLETGETLEQGYYARRFKKVDALKPEVGGKIRALKTVVGMVKGQTYDIVDITASGMVSAKGRDGVVYLYKDEYIITGGKPKPEPIKEIPVGSIVLGNDWDALNALPNGSVIVNVSTSDSKSPITKANGDWFMVGTDGKDLVKVNYWVDSTRRQYALLYYGQGVGKKTDRTV